MDTQQNQQKLDQEIQQQKQSEKDIRELSLDDLLQVYGGAFRRAY